MVDIWTMFFKFRGHAPHYSLRTNLPSLGIDKDSLIKEYNELNLFERFMWDYKDSKLYQQLKEINQRQNTSFKVVKSFCIRKKGLQKIYEYRKQQVRNLIDCVKNRKFEYDEDDTSTWVDNFIWIEWEGEKVFFSHETPEGELLWGLYNSLEPLKKEIELDGALCVVVID